MKRVLGGIALVGLLGAAPAEAPAPGKVVVSFDEDKPGEPAKAFEPVVGDWYVAEEAGQKGLKVDGSKWRQGTPSANLADSAKKLYGDRYAEFLDGVKAFAFFPLTVWQGDCSGDDVTLSMRFYPEAGRIDQGAGIAFDIRPDGSYWGARANALEDNLLFFKVVKGHRTVLQTVRGVHTATKAWHTLKVHLQGERITVDLDGEQKLDRKLEQKPAGRCGIWSKADSVVLFDDYTVERAGAPASK